ncbi:hypothetical protein GCM10008906_22850 [Clostridium oceanicum]|uniref:Uncharacterized protein n=1 Tax=Clostridium oceanicum TaxID=1543 RepID=A0ABP3US93_9CLOT
MRKLNLNVLDAIVKTYLYKYGKDKNSNQNNYIQLLKSIAYNRD